MSNLIRVLIVEDSEDDALLIVRHLKAGGYEPQWQRVDTVYAMSAALAQAWDVAIIDYSLPQLNGIDALGLIKETGIDLPAIIVSGVYGEEIAVEVMKAGAADYVLKEKLSRLVPALSRELQQAKIRKERIHAQENFNREKLLSESIINNIPAGVAFLDNNFVLRRHNVAYASFLRRYALYAPEQAMGMAYFDYMPGSRPQVEEWFVRVRDSGCPEVRYNFELSVEKNGKKQLTWWDTSIAPVFDAYGATEGILLLTQDVTERVQITRDRDRLFNFSIDMFSITGFDGYFKEVNPAWQKTLGFTKKELLAKPLIHFVYPLDRAATKLALAQLRQGREVVGFDSRFCCKDGTFKWISWNAFPLPEENVIFSVARDILVQKLAHELLQRSEARYRTLIERATDAIFMYTRQGKIVDVNPAALKSLGYSRKELLSMSLFDIEVDRNHTTIQRIIRKALSGAPVIFEGWYRRKDGSRFPVEINIGSFEGDCVGGKGLIAVVRDASERNRTQEALAEAQRKLVTLMSNLPGMAYRCRNDKNWTMEFVSRGCKALTGYSPEAILGNSVLSYADIIAPQYRDYVWSTVQEALKLRKPFQLIYRIKISNGKIKWVWEQGSGVYGEKGELQALEGFITDISDRKNMEESLRISEEQYRLLFENNPHPMWVADAKSFRFLAVNDAALRHYGYSRQEFLRMGAADIRPKEDVSRFNEYLKAKKNDAVRTSSQWRHRKQDGTVIDVDVASHAIVFAGKKARLVLAQDITERKRVEVMREALIRNVSHELKTPVAMLSMVHDMATRAIAAGDIEQIKKSYSIMHECIVRLKKDISNILQISALEKMKKSKTRALSFVRIELRRIIDRMPLTKKGISFSCTIPPAADKIGISAHHLHTLLYNLLDNAVKFSTAGSIKIRGRGAGNKVILYVRDAGCGMTREQQGNVFTRFFKAHPSFSGTGLGLAICKDIVDLYGGSIAVSSAGKNKGTTVTLVLPRARGH
ncbi:MAG: PAS domain S-box protein [Candidatus Omnitrophota bacterium]|nr:PAS domain S-box protein [Candidatus Omnitrophota bacterium]